MVLCRVRLRGYAVASLPTTDATVAPTGDGSTRFTVLLHAALEHCESALGRARLARAQTVTPPLQRRMLGLARWFGRIQAEGGFLEEVCCPLWPTRCHRPKTHTCGACTDRYSSSA